MIKEIVYRIALCKYRLSLNAKVNVFINVKYKKRGDVMELSWCTEVQKHL